MRNSFLLDAMGKRHSHLHRRTTSMMSLVNSKIKVMQCQDHQTAGYQMLFRRANQEKSLKLACHGAWFQSSLRLNL